jgi:hypothetical protein
MAILKNVFKAQTRDIKITNAALVALNFIMFLTGATANTAIVQPGIDPDKVHIKAVLDSPRLGISKLTILEGRLYQYALESNFHDASWTKTFASASGFDHDTLLAEASGVKEIAVHGYKIHLHEGLVLKGDDVLTVTIRVENDACAATVDSAVSYVGFSFDQGIINPTGIPVIEQNLIDVNQPKVEMTLGDDIVQLTYLNTDKTGILTANQPLDNARLESDKLSFDKTIEELIVDRYEQFPVGSQSNDRAMSMCLVPMRSPGNELDDARLVLNLDVANVSSSKNWVVVRKTLVGHTTLKDASLRAERHFNVRRKKKLNKTF